MFKQERSSSLLVKAGAFSAALKGASLFKMSYIVGSYAAYFSATSIVAPLAGAWGGAWLSMASFSISLLISSFFGKMSLFKLVAFHLPGLCAGLYWSSRSSLIRVVLPLVCMAIFMLHPVGGQAAAYALYWLIPVALYATRRTGLVYTALGSTFVAHAVGSVAWLYVHPMTPAVWLGLIPVVALERCVYTLGMVLVYRFVCSLNVQFKHLMRITHAQTAR